MTGSSRQDPGWPYPGARWWKFDFHTHTPASVDGRAPDPATAAPVTPRDWLLGFMRAEVDCVAVTDHNSGDWIDRLKQSLAEMEANRPSDFRPLHLFPGVELSVNGGFHLLAVFGPETSTGDIDTLLGAVSYEGGKGSSDGVTRESAVHVVDAVLGAGGIPIPAHADSPKGLLQLKGDGDGRTEIDPATATQVLETDGVLAMEVVEPDAAMPEVYRQRRTGWAEVLGSDFHPPYHADVDGRPGSRFTWIKMADPPTLEGLRLALLDAEESSVLRSDRPGGGALNRLPSHFVEQIEIRDARYMGRGSPARLAFSPWLNALVGGRGTGKSTVVHALRLAARREREMDQLRKGSVTSETFRRFNRVPTARSGEGGLAHGTRIRLVVRRRGVRHRIGWARGGRELVVDDHDGAGWVESASQSVSSGRFPMRIFNQGQIAELAAEDQDALLRVIDEASGAARLAEGVEKARREFEATRARIRVLDSQLAERPDEVIVQLQDVERKLAEFEEAGHARILTEYRRRSRQRRELDRHFEVASAAARAIESTTEDMVAEDIPPGVFGETEPGDIRAVETVHQLAQALRTASERVRAEGARLRKQADTERTVLAEGAWADAARTANDAYERFVEDFQQGVADPNEYSRLVQERALLLEERAQTDSKREERYRLEEYSRQQLDQVLEARRKVSACRVEFLESALAANEFVSIEIRPYGVDPQAVERSLRAALGVEDGRFASDILTMEDGQPDGGIAGGLLADLPDEAAARRQTAEHRLDLLRRGFQEAAAGRGEFGGHFNNYLERECSRDPAMLDALLAWIPEDGLHVEYSRSGDGRDFRPIGQASAGQRSAAMLAFLLSHGEEPLILDQPEDDLDNHLIYDLVVRQIRENKTRRQLIVVTHNPNIVVNGDAEMLHALAFAGGQCHVSRSGSLQDAAMRDEVCRVMEGGREAFRRRFRRLGTEVAGA